MDWEEFARTPVARSRAVAAESERQIQRAHRAIDESKRLVALCRSRRAEADRL
jgi:hypothetical protein